MVELEILEKFVPFSDMEPDHLLEFSGAMAEQTFVKGEMLFKRGKELDTLFFLVNGEVDLIGQSYTSELLTADDERAKKALNSEVQTSFSCVAKSTVTALSIKTKTYDRLLAWTQSAASVKDNQEHGSGDYSTSTEFQVTELAEEPPGDWMSALLQSPMLLQVPLTQVQDLFMRFEHVEVNPGDIIVKEGELGDYFYVISSGQARVSNRSESVDILLETGDYFGEEALVGNTTRNATVVMETYGVLKRLNTEDFNDLLKKPVLKYVDADELKEIDKPYKLLDVKLPLEHRIAHVPGSLNVPLSNLRNIFPDLNHESLYVVTDDSGSRADIAAHLLCQAGYEAIVLKDAVLAV